MSFATDFGRFFQTTTANGSDHARHYLLGLIQAGRGRKNMERMEELVPDLDYEGVQHFIANSPWDHEALVRQIAAQADGLLGGAAESRFIIDESANSKKGTKSVGVARQYNGRQGKVDNCQVAVFGSLSAGQHSTLVGMKLYLPQEEWCDDPAGCESAGIPEIHRQFKTKAQLGLELVAQAREQGLRFGMVCVDAGYGSQISFLHGLDQLGEQYVAEVHCNARIYTENPWVVMKDSPDPAGSRAKKSRPCRSDVEAQRIDQWAAAQPDTAWERLKVRESTRGWVEVNYLAERMWIWDKEKGESVLRWVLVWRNPDDGLGGRLHYALSNAPADADERRLIGHGVNRFWVERNFQDAKSEAGLADYQVRGWLAWHHHTSLVMLTMLFLCRERVIHGAAAPELPLSCGDVVFLLAMLLPKRATTQEEVFEFLEKRRRKRIEDQRRRRDKTARNRSPVGPLEEIPK